MPPCRRVFYFCWRRTDDEHFLNAGDIVNFIIPLHIVHSFFYLIETVIESFKFFVDLLEKGIDGLPFLSRKWKNN